MNFPDGLATRTLELGPYTTPSGRIASGRIGVGFDKPMLHAPTGDVIVARTDYIPLDEQGVATAVVPVTISEDLATIPEGMRNQRLRLVFDISGYSRIEYLVDIDPSDPAVIDGDTLVPYTSSGEIAVMRATVSSVASLVGDISAESLAAVLEPHLPGGSATQQVVFTGTASASLSGHTAVVRGIDGSFVPASNDTAAHASLPIWLTTGSAAQGAPVTTLAYGEITEPSWSFTPGAVFLGQNGALTQAQPTAGGGAEFSVILGYATSPTTLFVDKQSPIFLT